MAIIEPPKSPNRPMGILNPGSVERTTKKGEITLREVQNMKVLFGKHKGKPLTEIPLDYLQWLESEKISQREDTNSYFMRCLNFAITWKIKNKVV